MRTMTRMSPTMILMIDDGKRSGPHPPAPSPVVEKHTTGEGERPHLTPRPPLPTTAVPSSGEGVGGEGLNAY